ncbi:MAG: zinc ribbon domain-containing protein [Candidatus Helarchaeales archaeon]
MEEKICFWWWYWRPYWWAPLDPYSYTVWLVFWLIFLIILVGGAIATWHLRRSWWKERIRRRNEAISRRVQMQEEIMADRAAARRAALRRAGVAKPFKPMKPIKPPKTAATGVQEEIRFCRHCGAEVPPGTVYCGQCGKKV